MYFLHRNTCFFSFFTFSRAAARKCFGWSASTTVYPECANTATSSCVPAAKITCRWNFHYTSFIGVCPLSPFLLVCVSLLAVFLFFVYSCEASFLLKKRAFCRGLHLWKLEFSEFLLITCYQFLSISHIEPFLWDHLLVWSPAIMSSCFFFCLSPVIKTYQPCL